MVISVLYSRSRIGLVHYTLHVADFAGLLGRVCPAAVYEYQDAEGSQADAEGKKFVINSQNCIHVSSPSLETYTVSVRSSILLILGLILA